MNTTITLSTLLPILAAMFGGGVGVALVAQAIKKVFGLDSAHVIHLMVVAVAVVVSAAQYALQLRGLPPEVLGISATTIYGFSQVAYREAVYVSDFINRVNAYYNSQNPEIKSSADIAPVDLPDSLDDEQPTDTGKDDFSL